MGTIFLAVGALAIVLLVCLLRGKTKEPPVSAEEKERRWQKAYNSGAVKFAAEYWAKKLGGVEPAFFQEQMRKTFAQNYADNNCLGSIRFSYDGWMDMSFEEISFTPTGGEKQILWTESSGG